MTYAIEHRETSIAQLPMCNFWPQPRTAPRPSLPSYFSPVHLFSCSRAAPHPPCHSRESGNPSSLHPRARCTSSQISNCRSAILPLSPAHLLTCSPALAQRRRSPCHSRESGNPSSLHPRARCTSSSPISNCRSAILPLSPVPLLTCSPALAQRPRPPAAGHDSFYCSPAHLFTSSRAAPLLSLLSPAHLFNCSPALVQRRPPQTPLKTRQNHPNSRQNRRTFRQNALTFRQKTPKKCKKFPKIAQKPKILGRPPLASRSFGSAKIRCA